MPYDFRELIIRDIVSVSQVEPHYYFVRFKKAMMLLDKDEIDEMMDYIDDFKHRNGLEQYSLRDLEDRMAGKGAFKVRTENEIRLVSIRQLYLELAEIDDWLDSKIKEKAKLIRWSNPQDAFRARA